MFCIAVWACLLVGPRPASAQASPTAPRVDVVEVSGVLDPIQVDFLRSALSGATTSGAEVLVIRLDSQDTIVPQAEVDALAREISSSTVPVAVWVGQSRAARAYGGAATLVEAATISGMAPGTRLGASASRSTTAEQALDGATIDLVAPTLQNFIVDVYVRTPAGGALSPEQLSEVRFDVRFDEPSLLAQMLHAVTTPSVAYVLLLIGLSLVVFELFSAGIGVAAGVAAVCLLLSSYGLGALPTRPVGLVLILLAVVGYAVDVQAGSPRAWTAIATLALVVGSLLLYDDQRVPLHIAALALVGIVLFMVSAMPSVVRTRFSTPTIGRESMIGEHGRALSAVDPDGVVQVRDAPWRARTNRATPILAGDTVRVAAIDGLLLEVEPLEGAARDAGH